MNYHWEKQDHWKLGFGYWYESEDDPHGWEIYLGKHILCFYPSYLGY